MNTRNNYWLVAAITIQCIILVVVLVLSYLGKNDTVTIPDVDIAVHLAVTDLPGENKEITKVSSTGTGYKVTVSSTTGVHLIECMRTVSSRPVDNFYMSILYKDRPFYVSKTGKNLITCWHHY